MPEGVVLATTRRGVVYAPVLTGNRDAVLTQRRGAVGKNQKTHLSRIRPASKNVTNTTQRLPPSPEGRGAMGPVIGL